MENKMKRSKLVLILSLLGITSVLITIISDFILVGKPSAAYDFLILGTESMWDIPAPRITIGTFVGVVALPFQLLGLVPLYYSFRSAGKVLPMIAIIINAHTLLMGVAFHISYAFMGSSWTLHHQPDATLITTGLVEQYNFYWMILAVIMTTELLFSSVVYTVIVLRGKSLFPKWMAIFSPMAVVIITLPLIFLIPSPIGGYIAPACLNISTMIFFILTLAVGYKKIKQIENSSK